MPNMRHQKLSQSEFSLESMVSAGFYHLQKNKIHFTMMRWGDIFEEFCTAQTPRFSCPVLPLQPGTTEKATGWQQDPLSCEYLGMGLRDFVFLALFLHKHLYILCTTVTPKIKISGLLPLLQKDNTFDSLGDSKPLAIQPARSCPDHQQGKHIFVWP